MVPPAPPMFSMTMGWPSLVDTCCAMVRATASVGPPAAPPTIQVIGRSGQDCAKAPLPKAATEKRPAVARVLRMRFIRVGLGFASGFEFADMAARAAHDGRAFHVPPLRLVVVAQGQVHGAAVVPEQDVVRLPAMPVAELRPGGMADQEVDQGL